MTSCPASDDVVCAGVLVADLFIPPLMRLPVAGELLATQDFLADSGGCAANTATALAKLGVCAVVAGKVGNDIFGDFIIRDLQRKGVDVSGISRSTNHGTSKTVILPVTGEDRRYIHTFGANADFAASDVDVCLSNRTQVFYLGGYLTLPNLRASELCALLQRARAGGVRTVLDVVLPVEQTVGQSALVDVLPHVEFFLPNDYEAGRLTGETDPQRQARQLLRYGCDTVVITMGERGALLMNPRETIEMPAFVTPVVDPSGAGDAFAAGFIVGVLEKWEMAQILRFASAIGASACMALGCNAGVFTRPQADAFLVQG
jgi:sugar/nucleoside kinase (ribokinase family)